MTISKELFEAVMEIKKEAYLQDIENVDEFKIIYSYTIDEQFPELYYEEESINDFFFKCIDFMKDNDIDYYLDINNDIRNEVFEFLDKWLLENKDV